MNNTLRLQQLADSGRTVFSSRDLRDLWRDNAVNSGINSGNMVQRGLLLRLCLGYYALRPDYSRFELANLMVRSSYVSFNSVLFRAGVYSRERLSVDAVALLPHRRKVNGKVYMYYAMKEELFFNPAGRLTRGGVSLATPERAVLDSFYFGFHPGIDDLGRLDRGELMALGSLYPVEVRDKARRLYGP